MYKEIPERLHKKVNFFSPRGPPPQTISALARERLYPICLHQLLDLRLTERSSEEVELI